MIRANIGCNMIWPTGWWNVDRVAYGQEFILDLTAPQPSAPSTHGWQVLDCEKRVDYVFPKFDYIVANHVLNEIRPPDLPLAMTRLRTMLVDGGVLRVMVPDIEAAFRAWNLNQAEWFPTGDKSDSIDAKFCDYLTWYGTNVSVFTLGRLAELGKGAGFGLQAHCRHGETRLVHDPEITALDDRKDESIFWEFMR